MPDSADSHTDPSWIKNVPFDKVIEWRRHFHRNPELSFQEIQTSAFVAGLLQGFGNIEVQRPTPTSVLGILHGAKPGRTAAFRADMDALPVAEDTGLPFASAVDGVSHACGHDAHTAMLLGTAAALSRMRQDFAGTVYFIFQHAEEKHPGGARQIIDSGALAKVDAFFGMHVFSNFPEGKIGFRPGAASTASDTVYLTIRGKGSHGSQPHLSVDPVVTGSEIVMALQTVVSRNIPPGEPAVITVGKFQAGAAANIIPDTAELAATIRTVSEKTRKLVAERVKAIIDSITRANGATYDLNYIVDCPVVENDPALTALAKASAAKVLGDDQVFDAPRHNGSEDFARYKEVAPECMTLLGAGPGATNHSPKFNFDEGILANGVKAQVQIILDYLNQD